MAKRLTGLNPLAYLGVEPLMPANTYTSTVNPVSSNVSGFNIGDFWINTSVPQQIWILSHIRANVATWTELAVSGGTGASSFLEDDTNIVHPTALGQITVAGDSNITTKGNIPNTVTVTLNNNVTISGNFDTTAGTIAMSNTNAGGTQGVFLIGGIPYMHNYSDPSNASIYLGANAGNFTLTPANAVLNVGIGTGTLESITMGSGNTCIGSMTGNSITTGGNNIAIGFESFDDGGSDATFCIAIGQGTMGGAGSEVSDCIGIGTVTLSNVTGNNNIAIGSSAGLNLRAGVNNLLLGNSAGQNYTSTESSNIMIGNLGIVAESNVIRIGTAGSSTGQQNRCFVAGIRGTTTANADAVAVLVDSAGQLGTVSSSRVYKDNIISMDDVEGAKLQSLRPVTFHYKSDPHSSPQYGLIAEEVAEVMPDLVVYDEDGKPETIKYHILPSIIIKELQRLNDRINEMQVLLDTMGSD